MVPEGLCYLSFNPFSPQVSAVGFLVDLSGDSLLNAF